MSMFEMEKDKLNISNIDWSIEDEDNRSPLEQAIREALKRISEKEGGKEK